MDAQPRVLYRALRHLTGLHAVDEMPVFKIVAVEFVEVIAAGQFTTVQNDAFLLRGTRGGQRIADGARMCQNTARHVHLRPHAKIDKCADTNAMHLELMDAAAHAVVRLDDARGAVVEDAHAVPCVVDDAVEAVDDQRRLDGFVAVAEIPHQIKGMDSVGHE